MKTALSLALGTCSLALASMAFAQTTPTPDPVTQVQQDNAQIRQDNRNIHVQRKEIAQDNARANADPALGADSKANSVAQIQAEHQRPAGLRRGRLHQPVHGNRQAGPGTRHRRGLPGRYGGHPTGPASHPRIRADLERRR